MNKLAVAKIAARLVVGAGTTTISNSIIRNNVEPKNLLESVTTGVASVVIGSMAADATKSYTDRQIDAVVDVFKRNKTVITEDPTPSA